MLTSFLLAALVALVAVLIGLSPARWAKLFHTRTRMQWLQVAAAGVVLLLMTIGWGPKGLGAGGLTLLGMAGWVAATDEVIQYLVSQGILDSAAGPKKPTVAKTADYVIVTGTDPSGCVFTNRGAIGAVLFTLPAPSLAIAGTTYRFMSVAAQTITVATATADTFILLNDLTADSLAMSTGGAQIAGVMEVFCDGTSWVGYGIAVGVTFTVAT